MILPEVTAYFSAAECALRAGDDLSRMPELTEHISIGSMSPEAAHATDCYVKATFTGALLGVTVGMLAGALYAAGLSSAILPVSGLVCGAVTGAIAGCWIDFASYEALSPFPYLSCTASRGKCGAIVKVFREKGALKIELGM